MMGKCAGSVAKATQAFRAGYHSPDAALDARRVKMSRALIKLRVAAMEQEAETGYAGPTIEDAVKVAEDITQTILGRRSTRTQGLMRVKDIVAHTEIDGQWLDEHLVRKLQCSIQRFGMKNPLVVREVEDAFELISGCIRYEACRRLELSTIPVVVKNLDDWEAEELALLDILLATGRDHLKLDCVRAMLEFYCEKVG